MSNELWSIYLAGPDDLVAMPSKPVAEAVARNFNAVWERYGAERGHDVHAVAHVEPWMHGKEAHAKDLREHFHEYADLVLDEDAARLKTAQPVEAVNVTSLCGALEAIAERHSEKSVDGQIARAALAHPRPTGAIGSYADDNTFPDNDRDMLLYLMRAFHSESWECPSCGHSEDTATMDSASMLRDFLKAHPSPTGVGRMTVINPDEWQPCTPAFIAANPGGCMWPRVWNEAEQNHYHPKTAPTGEQAGEVVARFPKRLATADRENATLNAWNVLRPMLAPEHWNVGESATFYGFFCWGWEAATQYHANDIDQPRPMGVPDGWRSMETAPKDGTPVLLIGAPKAPERVDWLASRQFVGRHTSDSTEWSFAAPVGMGGIATSWLAGWMPLPTAPDPGKAGEA